MRVQLQRKKGWRMPPNTVRVARPSRYGNLHRVGWCEVCKQIHSQKGAVEAFRADWVSAPQWDHDNVRRDLKGKNLACWCHPNLVCHADVLLEIANG